MCHATSVVHKCGGDILHTPQIQFYSRWNIDPIIASSASRYGGSDWLSIITHARCVPRVQNTGHEEGVWGLPALPPSAKIRCSTVILCPPENYLRACCMTAESMLQGLRRTS